MGQRPRVIVVGSLNADISLQVPHLPGAGETVLSPAAAVTGSGGKGANQAVAAARLGAAVRMIGCCGDDQFGSQLRAGLDAEGIDASGVRVITGMASGLALITVDPAGENAIAVAAGANGMAGDQEVTAAFATPCDVLVLSAEVPAAALAGALREGAASGVTTLLNLAPVPPRARSLLACQPDWLVINSQEAGALAGVPVTGAASAGAVAAALASGDGARHVVITVGADGAVLAGPQGSTAVPGFAVDAVDSVGAGDAFVGALAVALAAGADPAGAVRAACAAGAAAATRRGAQTALPRPADVRASTGFQWPFMSR